ncbi:glutathione synthase [Salinisphaera hydrothermalis]|uniref:Glutathione synthetase n=1 Tax=Salinisphaera hydrothermalis (strain C41B8) TaxID=1304275 RepID=A0A084ILG1_SALHC|nr:glutathione synthase [Salinisphaera hydrothermalis]KEZ77545.1 glutathione synthetase [Salinisphaera hydrothermalis C41B8]
MAYSLGVVMDPIEDITPYKDTTLALLLEAQRRGYTIHYFTMSDLFVADGVGYGTGRTIRVADDNHDWFAFTGDSETIALADLDVILMRKDPPFDTEYIYATYILELAENEGTLVVNRCDALRDVNEKMAINRFAHLCGPTLVARRADAFRRFIREHRDVVLKPLDGMGGSRIFRVTEGNDNTSVILEVLTEHGTRYAMAQAYLPAITDGDKRVLLVDGEPVGYALARVPAKGELRGNLAAGGRGVGRELTEADLKIAREVGPYVRDKGLLFVGLDVIGDKLTEINVTSPTCVRELEAQFGINICAKLFDAIEKRLDA